MANYPTSLDNFTNPTVSDSLNFPSHSLQHADANDAIEALETKLGIGASPAGSAIAGQVLTASTGGTTTWANAVSGLNQIVPTSVTKGASGTASVSAGGAVVFSGTESISLNGCFSSTYDNYRILINATGSTGANLNLRMRVSGVDNSSSIYKRQFLRAISTTVSGSYDTSTETLATNIATESAQAFIEIFSPALAAKTRIASNFSGGDINFLGLYYTLHDTATAYDGFSLIPSSGTTTGTIRVYGYRNG